MASEQVSLSSLTLVPDLLALLSRVVYVSLDTIEFKDYQECLRLSGSRHKPLVGLFAQAFPPSTQRDGVGPLSDRPKSP